MRRLAWLLVPLALLPWGCSAGSSGHDDVFPPNGGQGANHANGGAAGQGGDGAQGGNGSGGAEETPVYLSVTANPLASNGVSPSPSDELNAELTAFALGVRAAQLVLPWDELDPNDLGPLTQRVNAYAERPLRIVLEVAVVDHRADRRPAALSGAAWNAPESVANLLGWLDALMSAVGTHLDAVVLGRSVNAYLEQHPGDAAGMQALLQAGLDRLAELAPELPRGVSLRFVSDEESDLAALGTVAVFNYLPGLGEDTIPQNISAANDLDAMIVRADGRPVLLEAVGFTSARALASSSVQQSDMLAAFFTALEPRRSAIPWVNVFQLHDLQPAACDTYAVEQGVAPTDPQVAYVCSAGVRDTQGQAKDAWTDVIEASAQLAAP